MALQVALNHVTRYRYDRPVMLGPQVVRLRPAPHCRTPISAYSLRVTPAEHFLNWQQDPFGNYQARLVIPKPTVELTVEVDLIADLTTINPFDFFLEESVERLPFTYDAALRRDLAPYLAISVEGARTDALAARLERELARPGRRTVDLLVDVNLFVQRTLRYDIRMEPGVFPPDETLLRGHGSCRDFAWLMVQLLRRLGFAARFVSGYSIQVKADQPPLEGPPGVAYDCTDLHAWAEVFLPGAGWVGLDATSGLLAGEGHIPLACTAEPSSAAAVTGSFGWAKDPARPEDRVSERLDFTMKVERVDERPRSTKPYTDEQWQRILACGDEVDRALVAGDVRLTMGGEPTFVSVDDPDGAEWNTAAHGAKKAELAHALLGRLQARFTRGALLHHGQGKWYPGEPLPRWAYSCYWRKDGEPIWRDPGLFADGRGREQAGEAQARAFIEALATGLGVGTATIAPAYEDAWYYLWRERRLPVNVDPYDARLEDEGERARLGRIFEQGVGSVVGYALPLEAVNDGAAEGVGDVASVRFRTGRWHLRDERLRLLPGDSPMGFRLPLDSLPWVAPGDREEPWPQDPGAPRGRLPSRLEHLRPMPQPSPPDEGPLPARGTSAKGVVRTALCVEPRGGTLHVFLPPQSTLEELLALTAAIEDVAAALRQPVRLEGYHPPSDHRLQRLQVTPDPGVIEVNIHPAASWRELVANTVGLYEDARATRLGTEKFNLDGRHTGTGGGNHVVLGGPTPADSPLLRRPDLLASLIAYWVNHPSLSYLFSGTFIGPTSQAPRVDEGRQDALHELGIALSQVTGSSPSPSGAGPSPPPWLVDRIFRNLLVDVTGNTHRTELCIDKLYSPDSASGRLGLLELRAFEMPPDARMSCAQQLLLRAVVAWLWRAPYRRPPVRWGTALVDRFLLPHYVAEDFDDVLLDLAQAGFDLRRDWFEAHHEFRFPRHGQVAVRGLELELRQALEPWHVMGEEPSGGGAVRFVDSSVERLQVRLRGAIGDRYVLTCNGRRVPLAPTLRHEEQVAGVRFRAWRPPSALHPTVGVHAPLVFDVVDTWAGRSIGGCTYHVAHPGGRAYDAFPANAREAESRRAARFFPFGHTPGPMVTPPEEGSRELPHTLDLRTPALQR
jgi:uncharacterized protein (DUF2126 family)